MVRWLWLAMVLVGLVGTAMGQPGEVLWAIGAFDDSYAELALVGHHADYPAAFPQDVAFSVGTSDPARDWPFIQPGPSDAWAGSRQHPFRIGFELNRAVDGDALLVIDLVNTHWGSPPVLEIEVNGRRGVLGLPPGGDDRSLHDPNAGQPYTVAFPFPGEWLSVGRNAITLILTGGSWVLYDALRLGIGRPPLQRWAIGVSDNSFAEFAIAGDYGRYPQAFPEDVTFRVGQSQAARDWPFIQPGPSDAWAGSRPHPFRIEFDLPAAIDGDAWLTIDLASTHGSHPPVLRIEVNGHRRDVMLPRGSTDDALTDGAQGREQVVTLPFSGRLLTVGRNEVILTLTEGSWVLYDAIAFAAGVPAPSDSDIRAFRVQPTVLFARDGGELHQVLHATIDNWGGEQSGRIRVALGDRGWTVELPVMGFGQTRHVVLVPEVATPTPAQLRLMADGRVFTAEVLITPQRKWKVFISPHIHTDIGYTALQTDVIALHQRNLDQAIEACERLPELIWNLEVAWQAQVYLRDRPPEQQQRLLDLMRRGRIGLHASYLNLLTGLCSHEELNRLCSFAKRLQREYGVPVATATITDVPSCVGALPMILAGSGVRCFAQGINSYRGPFFDSAEVRSPFWWEGPDGSRVLAWFTSGYAQIGGTGLLASCQHMEEALPGLLRGYDHQGYPYDAVLVYGAFGDNAGIDTHFGQVAAEWNARWAYPQIILCRDEQFFDYVRDRFADRIPTFRGDAGGWWEDGAASSAYETALNRRTHEAITTAETLHSLVRWADSPVGAVQAYPAEALRQAWDDVLWYDEHTWGAWHSVSQPDHPNTAEQWRLKAEPAYRAAETVGALVQDGLRMLAAQVRTSEQPAILVFNPLSWERSEVAHVTLPQESVRGPLLALTEAATGRQVPVQAVGQVAGGLQVAFRAENVPPLGYRLYRWADGVPPASQPASPPAHQLENPFFRVQIDPATGGIASIWDKRQNRELLDRDSLYRANQYLYATGGEGTQAIHKNPNLPPANFTYHTLGNVQVEPGASGPLFSSLTVRGQALRTPRLESEIILYHHQPRIDIVNRFTKEQTYDKEGVYFAFPFAADPPRFTYEAPDSIVEPARDMLKGACLDWFAVQHWVDVSGPDAGVTWASPDTPLVCLGELAVGKWRAEFQPPSGSVFAYVMNNYWDTNYKAGQGGDFSFRYALTSHAGQLDPVAATRFGWEVANPLLTISVPANQAGPLPEAGGSFCSLDRPNVVVLTVKQADDGDGWIVRLWEVAGRSEPVRLTFPQWRPTAALLTNLVEENQEPLQVEDRAVIVPVGAKGVVTVRVR